MSVEQSQVFVCPACTVDETLAAESSSQLVARDGELACARCRAAYPVIGNIARFVPAENYAASFGYQWNVHRRTQLDSHSGIPISRSRLERATRWPDRLAGELVLEAGSGAGRFTEVLLQMGARVVSFDFSRAVDANAKNNAGNPRLTLFQGDIFSIPLRRASFDKVLCLGVLQHTPDPARAFRSLARMVRPGGQLVIDVYARRVSALLSWKYLLRPVTRRMDSHRLYRIIERLAPPLIPAAAGLRRVLGRAGARMIPIVEYSHLGLDAELNRQWAILDTFDMYAPAHDHPQRIAEVRRWFESERMTDVEVENGPNGIVGRGRRRSAEGPVA